jgi:hypothetical protein
MRHQCAFGHAARIVVVDPLELEAGELRLDPLGDGVVARKLRLSMATRALANRATAWG